MYSIVAMDETGKQHYTLEETMTLETLRINGDNVITFEVEYTDINKELFSKIDKRWKIKVISDRLEKVYVVQNIYETTYGDSMYMSIDTLYEPHDKLKREMVYKEHSGSKTRDEWFRWLFEDSWFKCEINAPAQYATNIQSFGYDSRLSLFLELLNKYQLEYYFTGARNDIIAVRPKIGEDKSDYISYGVNLINLTRSRQMGSFGTIGKMFGAYIDEDKPEKGRHVATYRSPLADHYGEIPIKPLVDERFKIKENMEAEIKSAIESSIITSIDVNFDELTFERDGGWVSIGDSIVLIDERLGLSIKIRVVQIDTTYNPFGDIVNINYTLGNFDEYYISQTTQLTYPKEVDDKLQNNKHDASQSIKDAKDELDKTITAETDKIKDDLNKFGDDLHIIREKLEVATDMANGAGRIYRQRLEPVGDKLNHGDLWYKPTWNSVSQRDEVRMYQYQKEGNIGKWVEVIDVELGNADNLNRGQINARTVNLINLNADEIVTGTIRGKNLQIDLDRGLVEFQRGRIYKDDDSFIVDVDEGSIRSKNPDGRSYFNVKKGEISIGSPSNPYGGDLGRIGYLFPFFNAGGGMTMEGEHRFGVATKGAGVSKGGTFVTGDKDMLSLFADTEVNIKVKQYNSGSLLIRHGEGSNPARVQLNNGVGGQIAINGVNSNSRSNINIFANATNGGERGTIWLAGKTISMTGDMSVTGKKNAIHVTRDGVRETPAYETATSYIGDIGEVTTNEHGLAIVEIPDLMYDIANFDMDYQVFITPYDFCQFKVGSRTSTHFTIETDKANCKVGYEYKARRRGYESEWLCLYETDEKTFKDIAYPEHDEYAKYMEEMNRIAVFEKDNV